MFFGALHHLNALQRLAGCCSRKCFLYREIKELVVWVGQVESRNAQREHHFAATVESKIGCCRLEGILGVYGPGDIGLVDGAEGIVSKEDDEDADNKEGGDPSGNGLVVLILSVAEELAQGKEVEHLYQLGKATFALHYLFINFNICIDINEVKLKLHLSNKLSFQFRS